MSWPIMALAAAVQVPAAPAPDPAGLNPYAVELFQRDPRLKSWALRVHDRNRDGWLTLYEAQVAVNAFKELADADRDGRVTVGEFREAKAFVVARYGTSGL